MRNFQGTFETRKRLFISAFSTSMTVPLIFKVLLRFICLLTVQRLVLTKR